MAAAVIVVGYLLFNSHQIQLAFNSGTFIIFSMDVKASLQQIHAQLGSLINAYNPSDHYFDDFVERSKIISKAKELQHIMTEPDDLPMQMASKMAEFSLLRVVSEIDLLKHFPTSGYIPASTLAGFSGVQPALLMRILRMLAGTGYVNQDPENSEQFALSHLSKGLENGHAWIDFMYSLLMGRRTFHKFLTDPDVPEHKPLTEPTDPRYCPTTYEINALGTPYWEALYQNAEFVKMAQKAFASLEKNNPIIGHYDFGSLTTDSGASDRLLLVDVGGGQGQSIRQILAAYPHLDPSKFMLQDLEGPIAFCAQSKILPDTTSKIVHDFFTPQPVAAAGAKAYLLRRIIHDWADDRCVTILKNIAAAMAKDSVVLVADVVVSEHITEQDLPIIAQDWIVMSITGKERTAKGFGELFEAAGLELVKIHRHSPECGAGTIVEGRLKQ